VPDKLKPIKLALPTALKKVTSPRLSQQNASIIAVLEQQWQAAQQESVAMRRSITTAAPAASARTTALSANFRGTVSSSGLAPSQTQSAQGNNVSSVATLPFFNSLPITCTNDPTPRVLHVSGGQALTIFTPEAKYNQYTIVGCSFGPSQQGNSAYIFGPNGFKANLSIDFWSDNGITAHFDPWLAGVLDQNNIALVISPVGKQPIQKQGFTFYAARGLPNPDGTDQEVQLAYDSMPQSSVNLFDARPAIAGLNQVPQNASSQFPGFSFNGTQVAGWVFRYAYGHWDDSWPQKSPCYVNDVANNPSTGCAGYFTTGQYITSSGFPAQGPLGGNDTWDFSKLAPGFAVSSYNLFYEPTDPSTLCGAWDDSTKSSNVGGTWDASLTAQNQISVKWPVYWCVDMEAMPFANRTNKQVQSSYGVAVWVLGPRCIDPWTGQKDQSCMAKVKQTLG
jgi:hypothetical protein